MNSLKKIFVCKFLKFFPPWQKLNYPVQLLIFSFLIIFLILGIWAKLDKSLPFIQSALNFSPDKEIQSLYDSGKLKSAYDYIEFYESIPGFVESSNLAKIKNQIEATRGSLSLDTFKYHGNQMLNVLTGDGSDEFYSKYLNDSLKALNSYLPLDDARTLWQEYKNYDMGKR